MDARGRDSRLLRRRLDDARVVNELRLGARVGSSMHRGNGKFLARPIPGDVGETGGPGTRRDQCEIETKGEEEAARSRPRELREAKEGAATSRGRYGWL